MANLYKIQKLLSWAQLFFLKIFLSSIVWANSSILIHDSYENNGELEACYEEEINDEGLFYIKNVADVSNNSAYLYTSSQCASGSSNFNPEKDECLLIPNGAIVMKNIDAEAPMKSANVTILAQPTKLHDSKEIYDGLDNSPYAKRKKINPNEKLWRENRTDKNHIVLTSEGSLGIVESNTLDSLGNYLLLAGEDAGSFGPIWIKLFKNENGNFTRRKCTKIHASGEEDISFEYQFIYHYDVHKDDEHLLNTPFYLDLKKLSQSKLIIPVKNENRAGLVGLMHMSRQLLGQSLWDFNLMPIFDVKRVKGKKLKNKRISSVPLAESELREYGGSPTIPILIRAYEILASVGAEHYRPDDPFSLDTYLTPYATCSFANLISDFHQVCKSTIEAGNSDASKRCQVSYGDAFHLPGVHSGHAKGGDCVDVAPFKNSSGQLDLIKMQQFFDLALKYDITEARFAKASAFSKNFPTTSIREIDRTHNDHMHICFVETKAKQSNPCLITDPKILTTKLRRYSTQPIPIKALNEPVVSSQSSLPKKIEMKIAVVEPPKSSKKRKRKNKLL
jgi:hypothetical protein